MKCPHCAYEHDRVIDSRPLADGTAVRRRRECERCHYRFTTYEKIETAPLYVKKKDGGRELFDREKLASSMMKACNKRPISPDQINEIVDRIEGEVQGDLNGETSSQRLGEAVMSALWALDPVAYIRFASVYKAYPDLGTFLEELTQLVRDQERQYVNCKSRNKIEQNP